MVAPPAADEIGRRLEAGERLRDDGFFEEGEERSAGDEALEAVLLAAQRDPEEAKIPHYAARLAYIAFSPGVDRNHANFLVRTADELSYRQLDFIAAGHTSAAQSGMEVVSENYEGVYADLEDLQRRRIATVSGIPAPGRRQGTS